MKPTTLTLEFNNRLRYYAVFSLRKINIVDAKIFWFILAGKMEGYRGNSQFWSQFRFSMVI